MYGGLLALAAVAWVGITAPVEGLRRLETTMVYQPYVNEIEYMGVGCLAGGTAGAMVGSMAIVAPLAGAVVVPFSITKGAIDGCMVGASAGVITAKTYNAVAFYAKHFGN